MEKPLNNTTSIADNELEGITGGGFTLQLPHKSQCEICGKIFQDRAISQVKSLERKHFRETGHCPFRQIQ